MLSAGFGLIWLSFTRIWVGFGLIRLDFVWIWVDFGLDSALSLAITLIFHYSSLS